MSFIASGPGGGWVVEVAYPVRGRFGYDARLDERLERAAQRYDGDHDGSGSGFGMRDITWSFPRKRDAEEFADAAWALVEKEEGQIRLFRV